MPDSQQPFWRNAKTWQVVLVCYWLALFIGTHIPSEAPLLPTNDWDKAAHVAAFAGLAVLVATTWQLAAGHLTARHLGVVWLVIVLYAALDEWTQSFVRRDASVWDWAADALGAAIGLILFVWLRRTSV
jgi:VanZ family protein